LVVADWSAIEARVNPWLSNCFAGERKLEIFAKGEDVYKVNAAATFGVAVDAVDDRQRQIGKVQELACGFAGSIGAFAAMGRVYGVHLPESDAKRMAKLAEKYPTLTLPELVTFDSGLSVESPTAMARA
jgi:DNA polymerase